MFDLPDPVGMFEKAKNAGLEREIALDFLGTAYSGWLGLLWGLKKVPVIGPGLAGMAVATYVSIKNGRLFNEGKLRIATKQDMISPDLLAEYQTEWLNKEKK